ncbi:MAG: hypothetical protein KAU58_06130, partial [Candidatus Omnitrophica bacterium]|nr:hypothetical protein [Candidatus Omnitrophota bacterium]
KGGLLLGHCRMWTDEIFDLLKVKSIVEEVRIMILPVSERRKHGWIELKLKGDRQQYCLDRTIGQFADKSTFYARGGLDGMSEYLRKEFLEKHNIDSDEALLAKFKEYNDNYGFYGLKEDYPFKGIIFRSEIAVVRIKNGAMHVEIDVSGEFDEKIEQSTRTLLPYSKLLTAVNILLKHKESSFIKRVSIDYGALLNSASIKGDILQINLRTATDLKTIDVLNIFKRDLGLNFIDTIEAIRNEAPQNVINIIKSSIPGLLSQAEEQYTAGQRITSERKSATFAEDKITEKTPPGRVLQPSSEEEKLKKLADIVRRSRQRMNMIIQLFKKGHKAEEIWQPCKSESYS